MRTRCLLNHLVSAGKKAWRDGDIQHPRRPDIDDQPKLGSELDWQVAGAFASDDPINIAGRLSEEVGNVRAVEHQSA